MRVLAVEYLEEYKLRITFSDKTKKIVDFQGKLKSAKGIFEPLKDVQYFKQVMVDDCCASICWPNGADICPDVLYEMGQGIAKTKPKRKKTAKIVKLKKRSRLKASAR